ncbi:plasmid stabilization protein [Klebsiella pneumoniae]|nr:plasmid partitioning/stability family protein [Klebsiella pneumoniae]RRF67730.1 plasmid stabilization protein [Klebsiella pneumoniae]
MTLDRRKVLIYLRPDISASERFADAKIEAHHRGDRGDMSRTALLAGLALGEVDSRLPSMLAALLAEDTKPETLRKMLASFRRISRPLPPRQPRSNRPAKAGAARAGERGVSARNLAGSLPD